MAKFRLPRKFKKRAKKNHCLDMAIDPRFDPIEYVKWFDKLHR